MDRFVGVTIMTFLLLMGSSLLYGQKPLSKDLKQNFANPPMEAWPKTYYWWLNGNIDTVRVREEIKEMKAAGLSGFDIFETGVPKVDTMVAAGPAFLSEASLASIKVALDQAGKLGMNVGLNMASSWNAGGSWISPRNSAKSLYFSKVKFSGQSNLELPFPELPKIDIEGRLIKEQDQKSKEIKSGDRDRRFKIYFREDGKPEYYEEVVVLAIPANTQKGTLDTLNVINVSKYFNPKTETLNWSHSGDYDIYRFITSNSGELLKRPSKNSEGPIIDHFDAEATAAHFNYVIGKLKSITDNDLENSSLKSLYLASYEAVGHTWTSTLPKKFNELNGYDIDKYLLCLFDQGIFPEMVTKKVKKDFQYTLSELMIDNFYRTAKKIANANSLLINSESGGPGFPLHNVPAEPLKSLGVMDLPRGEFWINRKIFTEEGVDIKRVVKEVSSAAHIYGRPFVEEEAFTSQQHWQEGPFDMKFYADRAFCEGMNKVVVHGSSHNPRGIGFPGIVYHAGTHYNDKRIWWPMIKPFNEYLSRISYVFQQTDFVADVLYYYGNAVPNFAGHKNGRFNVGPGYDYEVINTEILKQITVKNGELMLPTGGKFKLLVLEHEDEISLEVFLKVKDLVSKGAKIIWEKPEKVTGHKNASEPVPSREDIDRLWSKAGINNKKNRIISGITSIDMLQEMGVGPDIDYADSSFNILDYIHYSKNDSDYYFVRNTTDRWVSRQCSFRQEGKVPEIWDPVHGTISPISIYDQSDGRTSMPLNLPPFGAFFIVFTKGSSSPAYTKIDSGELTTLCLEYNVSGILLTKNGKYELTRGIEKVTISNYTKEIPINGAWEVFFSEGQNTPSRVIFPDLVSWTDSKIESIKYFSGIAKYVKTFQYGINSSTKKNQKLYLDLGDMSKMAHITLNGNDMGVIWAKPYRVEITEYLKAGDNILEIEVANTWSNRLKGDAVKEEKYTYTNIKATLIDGLNEIKVPWKDVPLLKSGLLGPVKIITLQPIK
ncbi:glycosyl hydrolase [Arenibacter algicola]|uniref:Alpha-L-rhamnosidase n=1 Tax=Arenibacter algicola TaxID=616991 RepID=A0A221UYP2_9FLAO|nr:glycosyl hydrolase [Arenibacter algicola]ASO06484.1 alpha-L-rhamnosidase [Arenibacter algicola]